MLSQAILERLGAISVQESGGGETGGVARGLFDRNMVVSGRACLDPLTPAYQEAPGAIHLTELSGYPETFGELVDQAEASALVVAPTGNDLASKTTYWTASATGNYILYSHPHLARTIRAYSFITYADYTPATWSLLGSNNGEDWATLHSGTAPEWGAGKNQVDEDIDSGNIAPYLHHKLVMGLVETVTGESVGTGDDATVLFNLDHTPSSEPTVYVDAVEQVLDTDYTRSGGAITFTSAPATDAVITADYEWTRTAVRIYALQLWTDGITTQLGVRAFADATDPLVIAFGNGETVEEVSLTSPLSVTIDPTSASHLPPSGASVYSLLAYADYDPSTEETVLGAEPVNVDDFIDIAHIRSQLADLGWSITPTGSWDASYPWTNAFDNNLSSYAKNELVLTHTYITFTPPEGTSFIFSGYKIKPYFSSIYGGGYVRIEYTLDGINWETDLPSYTYATDSELTFTEYLDSPKKVKGVRYHGYNVANNRSSGCYELYLYCLDISGIGTAGRKFGNGIVQIYDSAEEEWVQKNRVYMGTLNMGKGLDGNWAVNGFVPFNMPPQNLVPFPKKTFPARW